MNKPPRRVGLIVVPDRPGSVELAAEAAAIADQAGAQVWTTQSWHERDFRDLISESDLVICFGGDGTVIHAARVAAPLGVPVVGVNFGKMGFLSEFLPEEFAARFPELLAGKFWIEERVTLAIAHRRNGQLLGRYLAINEALVGRGRINRVVRLHTWVDDQYLTSYAADGLLVATPTGSTASNLAANGPILPPDMPALVMAPVMPFVSFRNPLVLHSSSQVDVQVSVTPAPPLHEAILSLDGNTTAMVEDGDRLSFTGSDVRCRFARVRSHNYFHAVLVPKLLRGPIEPPLPPDTPSPLHRAGDGDTG